MTDCILRLKAETNKKVIYYIFFLFYSRQTHYKLKGRGCACALAQSAALWLGQKPPAVGEAGGEGERRGSAGNSPSTHHSSLCHRDSSDWDFNKITGAEWKQWSSGVM